MDKNSLNRALRGAIEMQRRTQEALAKLDGTDPNHAGRVAYFSHILKLCETIEAMVPLAMETLIRRDMSQERT